MITLLEQLNYNPPKIEEYQKGDLTVVYDTKHGYYRFWIGPPDTARELMTYNPVNHEQAYELYSHYHFAKGHCICTGLGFGVRESWLLNKKSVSKITVIEKTKEVIEYQQLMNPELCKNIEIIHADVSDYKGKCDTLLIDHIEDEHDTYKLAQAHKLSQNIDCNVLWLWALEDMVTVLQRHQNRTNLEEPFITKVGVYNQIKTSFGLDRLPEVDEELLDLLYFMYNSKHVSNYEQLCQFYDENRSVLHPGKLIGEAE